MRPRLVLPATCVIALAVFCVVQDRETAGGARRYVIAQSAALAAGGPPVTIDAVLRPAVQRSVQRGFLWSGLVATAGVIAAAAGRRR
jgi:hypothetical protein